MLLIVVIVACNLLLVLLTIVVLITYYVYSSIHTATILFAINLPLTPLLPVILFKSFIMTAESSGVRYKPKKLPCGTFTKIKTSL